MCCLWLSCVPAVWQADQLYVMGIRTSSYSKVFSSPHCVYLKWKWAAATLPFLSVHTSEVSKVLLSTSLQWETNYCQTTPMQKNKRNPRLKLWLRLLRFCSWQLLFYLDGWCVFILCVILQCAHLCPFFTAFWSVLQMNYCKEMHIYIWIVYNHIYYVHTSMNNTHLLNFPLP